MSARPQVSVYGVDGQKTASALPLPAVFQSPIRGDLVLSVFTKVAKNKRQAYAVSENTGMQHSAESWGPGRAVARVPRISGSGTARAAQGAFANMCRGGRMFAPTKIWRRWYVRVNRNEKRYATASAIAATAVAPLVQARGHKIEKVPEIPLVVADEIESVDTTKKALTILKAVGAQKEVVKAIKSKKMRAGHGKMRGRRFTQRKGPLVIYAKNNGLVKAFRNIPGVDTCSVQALNLLQLAPGSHMGRFVIWSQSAFGALDSIYGSETVKSSKAGYALPKNIVSTDDIDTIINSSDVQSIVRPAGQASVKRPNVVKKNPLKNKQILLRLNPYAKAFSEKKLGSVKKAATKNVKHETFLKVLKE